MTSCGYQKSEASGNSSNVEGCCANAITEGVRDQEADCEMSGAYLIQGRDDTRRL
jgi:hypothetical protein